MYVAKWALELGTRGRQCRGIDALALRVVHRHVTPGVQRHRPDGVIIVFRPGGGYRAAAVRKITREECIYCGRYVIMLPGHQYFLVGEFAAAEEKRAGLSGRLGGILSHKLEARGQAIGQVIGDGVRCDRQ